MLQLAILVMPSEFTRSAPEAQRREYARHLLLAAVMMALGKQQTPHFVRGDH
jgi:hypothetical protein